MNLISNSRLPLVLALSEFRAVAPNWLLGSGCVNILATDVEAVLPPDAMKHKSQCHTLLLTL